MQAAVKPAASKPRRHIRLLPIVLGLCAFAILFASAEYLPSQVHGYPAPSITSMSHGGFSGFPPASITSMPVRGYGYPTPGYGHGGYPGHGRPGNGGWGYGGRYGRGNAGWLYGIPYYLPLDGYGDSYDYIPGPELYSAPFGPNDPTLHIIVEQSPTRYAPQPGQDDPQEQAAVASPTEASRPAAPAAESKPLEPTVLVFRDGHQQEVTNYAIMGQTVYVFDTRPHKYALADLDVPATVKMNDDRGVEFKVPPQKSPRKNTTAPQGQPTSTTDKPQDVAAAVVPELATN